MDVLSALAGILVIASFVVLVIVTEIVRRPRRLTPGEEEAKARSTGDESMNVS